MEERTQTTTAAVLDGLAGIWLIIAPFVLNYAVQTPRTNDIWVGIAVIVLALVRTFVKTWGTWVNWLSGLFGVWLILAPFILNYGNNVPTYNDVILGIIVVGLAVWSGRATYTRIERHAHA